MFSFHFNIIVYCLAGASAILLAIFMLLVMWKMRRVIRRSRANARLKMPSDAKFPPVSIIVHDDARSWNLTQLIPSILRQDYPAETEIIVVNDGSRHASEEAIASLEETNRNVYMTFLPDRSRSLSRRKMAIMLGVKAARYQHVVIVAGNALIKSDMWLRCMMRHFTKGKELVIGWAYNAKREGCEDAVTSRRRLRDFDSVRTALEYLSFAIAGHPWRGNGANIAFERELFYQTNGFAATLNLIRGDDDIWVKEVATRDNTAVELAPEAMIELQEDNLVEAHSIDKLRHEFTSRKPGRAARLTFAFASWMWWLAIGSSIAAIVIGLPSILPAIAITVIWTAICIPLMIRWRKLSSTLQCSPLLLTVPWLVSWHPFYALFYKLKSSASRRENYTSGNLM